MGYIGDDVRALYDAVQYTCIVYLRRPLGHVTQRKSSRSISERPHSKMTPSHFFTHRGRVSRGPQKKFQLRLSWLAPRSPAWHNPQSEAKFPRGKPPDFLRGYVPLCTVAAVMPEVAKPANRIGVRGVAPTNCESISSHVSLSRRPSELKMDICALARPSSVASRFASSRGRLRWKSAVSAHPLCRSSEPRPDRVSPSVRPKACLTLRTDSMDISGGIAAAATEVAALN